jgi:hypothetical protein
MSRRIAEEFEGASQKGIANENSRRFIESFMDRGPPAPEIVVVHGREIVMDKGITVNAFDGGSNAQCSVARNPKKACAFEGKEGPKMLALA